MKLLRQTPFLRPLLFFISGIVIQSYKNLPVPAIWIILFLSLIFIALSFVPKLNSLYYWRFLFGIGLCGFLFVMAAFSTLQTWKKSEWNIDTLPHSYKGRVIDDPVLKPKTYSYKVRIVSAASDIYTQTIDKKVIIYLPVDSLSKTVKVGDYLSFYGKLEKSSLYWQKQSFAATGFIRENHWKAEKETDPPFSILLKALSVRKNLLRQLQEIIPDHSSYALAAALMFGYRNELDTALRQAFADIGAAHILAISGTHFSILFGICYFMLSFIGNNKNGKITKQLILLPLIWGFAFVTGFSPSVIRAAFMLSIWGIGDAFFYRSFSLNTVAATAFFMLLFNPMYLYDVGFQLSFAAVVSIILINPHLINRFKAENPIIRYGWDISCVSIAAQAGVAPLSIYYFRQIPVIFLITNLFLLPLSTILLFLIPVSLIIHFVFGQTFWLMLPLNKILDFFIFTTQALDKISYKNIRFSSINEWDTLVLFIAITLVILMLIKKRAIYLYLLLILVLFQVFYYLC
jgi:competence protein ComEC